MQQRQTLCPAVLGLHCKNETKQSKTQNELGQFCGPYRTSGTHFSVAFVANAGYEVGSPGSPLSNMGRPIPLPKGIHPQKQGWKGGLGVCHLTSKYLFLYPEYEPIASLSLTRVG